FLNSYYIFVDKKIPMNIIIIHLFNQKIGIMNSSLLSIVSF
ncbi:MAG: hypothetical protein ACI90V_014419, partial [Bacillariaceae sp.]